MTNNYITKYLLIKLPINDEWVFKGIPYKVIECTKVLFWYKVKFQKDFFKEDEF